MARREQKATISTPRQVADALQQFRTYNVAQYKNCSEDSDSVKVITCVGVIDFLRQQGSNENLSLPVREEINRTLKTILYANDTSLSGNLNQDFTRVSSVSKAALALQRALMNR